MKEGGAHCVKLEGGREMTGQIELLTRGGIPVIGTHRLHSAGASTRSAATGSRAVVRPQADPRRCQGDRGRRRFAVVMEMVPGEVAAEVTRELSIPTIGIGAGNGCDGQVLVWQDAFGLRTARWPRFVKQYADLHSVLTEAAQALLRRRQGGHLPGPGAHFLEPSP